MPAPLPLFHVKNNLVRRLYGTCTTGEERPCEGLLGRPANSTGLTSSELAMLLIGIQTNTFCTSHPFAQVRVWLEVLALSGKSSELLQGGITKAGGKHAGMNSNQIYQHLKLPYGLLDGAESW